MKKILLVFLLLLFYQNLFSQVEDSLEIIGKQTSELLINGKKIVDFEYAIKLKKLYPEEDFSKFEDSPAEVILAMLYGAELELPLSWNKLLIKSEKFEIDKNSAYIHSYFYKTHVDSYIVSSVIKSKSKYYLFSYNLLKWEKEIFVSRIYKEIKEFKTIEEIEINPFIIIDNEIQEELKAYDEE